MENRTNKRIAIVLNTMSIGGIPKACVTFLTQVKQFYNVTLIVDDDHGELMSLIPDGVRVIVTKKKTIKEIAMDKCSKTSFFHLTWLFLRYYVLSHIFKRWVISNKIVSIENGNIVGEFFDCVIAYHGTNLNQITKAYYNIPGKVKIAWIHSDHPFEGVHKKDVEKIYKRFDKIYCVSDTVKNRFIGDFKTLESITEVYKNALDCEMIIDKGKCLVSPFDRGCINIVTVGRISKEKGQEIIPIAASLLLKKGYYFKWFLVGDGDDMQRLKMLCKEYSVNDCIVFTGSLKNPYPYIAQCDIYVQPSYTEGYCLTVCEAAILERPIVLTKIAADGIGLFENGVNAIINDKPDPFLFVQSIEYLLKNPEAKCQMARSLSKLDFSNKIEVNKLVELIGL